MFLPTWTVLSSRKRKNIFAKVFIIMFSFSYFGGRAMQYYISVATIHFAFVQWGKGNISLKSQVSTPSSFPRGCSKLTKLCFKCCLSVCFHPINYILKTYFSSYIYQAPPTQLFGSVQNSMSNKYHKGSPQTSQNSFPLLIHLPSFTNFYF